MAVGLTNYLVNAQIPTQMIEWTQAHIEQRWLFLLALNVFLLLVGTVMDIFSAIVVVVPLILPLADAYQITYVHLGVIFIANLELGMASAARPQPAARVVPLKPVLEVTLGNAADAWHSRDRGAAHHLRPWLTEKGCSAGWGVSRSQSRGAFTIRRTIPEWRLRLAPWAL